MVGVSATNAGRMRLVVSFDATNKISGIRTEESGGWPLLAT